MEISLREGGAAALGSDEPLIVEKEPVQGDIKSRVQNVVRQFMPIGQVFAPENKIDLEKFFTDQEFILNLVEQTEKLSETEMQLLLEKEVQSKFKTNHSEYTKLLMDLIKEAKTSKAEVSIDLAMKGRIFTLKNALIAQHSPMQIQKAQVQKGVAQQTQAVIRKAGHDFLISCFQMYHQTKLAKDLPFEAQLKKTTLELTPLLEQLTTAYLFDKGLGKVDDPLVYKDPKGSNVHGKTAASFLQVLLCVLGYQAKLLDRCDLDPKVTLSTQHAIVAVIGDDGKEYVVDAAYSQFLDDIDPEMAKKNLFPQNPKVLVFDINDLDQFLEDSFMKLWRQIREGMVQRSGPLGDYLTKIDNLTQFAFDMQLEVLPPEVKYLTKSAEPLTSDMEGWVKSSYRKVWHIPTYEVVRDSLLLEDLFYGGAARSKLVKRTHLLVMNLGLGKVIAWKSRVEANRELREMLRSEGSAKFYDSEKVYSLLGTIPLFERGEFAALCNVDHRHLNQGSINLSINAYFHHLHSIVNPRNKEFKAVYACCGADVLSFFLSTNATIATFVDTTELDVLSMVKQVVMLKRANGKAANEKFVKESGLVTDEFAWLVGGKSTYGERGNTYMPKIEGRLLAGLLLLGVDLKELEIKRLPGDVGVELTFPWQHKSDGEKRVRKLTFIIADITKQGTYPEALKQVLAEKIDAFYLKASILTPFHYPKFMGQVSEAIVKGGFTMTADTTANGRTFDPLPTMTASGATYRTYKSSKKRVLEETLILPFQPMRKGIDFGRAPREAKTTSCDQKYWNILELREKL